MVPEVLTVGLAVSMVAGLIMSTLHPDTDGFAFWMRLLSRVSVDIRIDRSGGAADAASEPDDGAGSGGSAAAQ